MKMLFPVFHQKKRKKLYPPVHSALRTFRKKTGGIQLPPEHSSRAARWSDHGVPELDVLKIDPDRIGEGGRLENFAMNDKCAAGTGRFLDVMAGVFQCKVSDLQGYDAQSTKIASISSTCTVFAESEVISKLAVGESIADIVAGIHESVAERTAGLAKRVGIASEVAMTGGVALNEGLRNRLSRKIGCPILISPLAQLNGALGAALTAREAYMKNIPAGDVEEPRREGPVCCEGCGGDAH